MLIMPALLLSSLCVAQKPYYTRDQPVTFTTPEQIATPTVSATSALDSLIEDWVQVVESPDSVQAVLFQPWVQDTSVNTWWGFKTEDSQLPMEASAVSDLQAILKDNASYQFGPPAKRCQFYPRLGFRFFSERGSLSILVATDCDIIEFRDDNGGTILKTNCDPGHNRWAELGNRLFEAANIPLINQ